MHRVAEARMPTRYGGDFTGYVYTSDVDQAEHFVLVKGDITPDEPVLVRPHAEYVPGDVFGYTYGNTSALLQQSMTMMAAEGRGVILYLRQGGQGEQLFRDTSRVSRGSGGGSTQASTSPGSQLRDFRDYGIGAQILRDLGVRKMRLLTNSPRRLISLPGYGLEVVETVPLDLPSKKRPTVTKKKSTAQTPASA